MRKLVYLFVIILFVVPTISFAASNVAFAQTTDVATLQVIALLREQIRLLEEIIKILTARLAPVVVQVSVLTPTISAEEKPYVRLSANGSGGKVSIKKGEPVTLSWALSKHNWGYCGKSFGWDGAVKSISDSEIISPTYDTRYDISCYLNSTKYSDSVVVSVIQSAPEPVVATSPVKPTYSITDSGFKSCSLEISPNVVTMGKDALEATWIVDSNPRNAYFYWRGKDNGVDIGKVYGGKTQRIKIFDYGAYPAKYERYVEMFFAQEHFIGDPYTAGCTTNTVTFEVKQ